MLAGLMHQIGKLPILVLVENIPEFRDHPDRLAKLLEKAHRPIGKIIMTSWNVPEDLKLVPSEYGNVNYDSDINLPATYVDVVQVAFFQSIARTQNTANNTNCDSLISFRKLGFSSETEILEIKGIPEIIKQTQSSLSL
jgi:HD-like signal output (HDOD) protein